MAETPEEPITFREPSYILFDMALNMVRTTQLGNLAIFSTESVVRIFAAQIGAHIKVIPVMISRIKS